MKKMFLITGVLLLFDLISKKIVSMFLMPNQSVVVIKNFFSITYVKNTGAAFSLLEGKGIFIIVMSIIFLVCIFKYIKESIHTKNEAISYSFIIGGAIGNLIDRIVYGYVRDFFDFNIFGYSAPIFNFADIFIVVGVCLLFLNSYLEGRCKDGDSFRRKSEN